MEKISYEKFQSYLQMGYPYVGLVKGVGYVNWEQKEIFFYKELVDIKGYPVSKNNYFSAPVGSHFVYKQITFILDVFRYRELGYEVVRKIQYLIKIIPPDKLFSYDIKLYYSYYDGKPPIEEGVYINKNDAIPEHKNPEHKNPSGSGPQGTIAKIGEELKSLDPVAKAGKKADDAIGPQLGVVEEFVSKGKVVPVVGRVLDILSIISDINDGDYYSAAGTIITSSAGVYGTIAEVAVWMANTDLMQTRMARLNAMEYKEAEQRILRADREGNLNDREKYRRQMHNILDGFKDNMDNLGVKYHDGY